MRRNFSPELSAPLLGLPTATDAEILRLQNTSSWAFDPFYRTSVNGSAVRGSGYNDPTEVRWGTGSYKNPQAIYTSGVIHTVIIRNLSAGARYGYRITGDERLFNFSMPVDSRSSASEDDLYPFVFALTADLGQTAVSEANMFNLLDLAQSAGAGRAIVLLAGDLSYADGFSPRWDSYARLVEPLASTIPVLVAGGDHEVFETEEWVAYNARYPMPYRSSGSDSNLWWSRNVGPVHLATLCSYAATGLGSLQYDWLEADLSAVDRERTPWLLVMMHVPWYNSNTHHTAEAELMRLAMEPLLYRFGVDIVITGHVRSYTLRLLPTTTHYLLPTTHYPLPTTHYPLLPNPRLPTH